MIDRPVAIVCRGHGTHPVRELVVLVPVRPRTDLEAARQVAYGFEPVDKSAVPGLLVTESDSVRRGFGVAESVTIVEGDESSRRVVHKSDARLINTPGVGWQVVHKGCPTCRSPLVLPIAHVVAYLAGEPELAGRPEIDVRPA